MTKLFRPRLLQLLSEELMTQRYITMEPVIYNFTVSVCCLFDPGYI